MRDIPGEAPWGPGATSTAEEGRGEHRDHGQHDSQCHAAERRGRVRGRDLPGRASIGLLHFQPQGFVDAWAALFFGAMLTGVAMEYALFLLSAAREHYNATGDPQEAMRTSGRVVVAAAGVMVAVFLTFALSGPLAPKEMGVILAVAVFLDALCIRLVILPVLLRLSGHGAWYSPAWLTRVLPTIRFSH